MSKPPKWIICEGSGRWTAAIRTAFARASAATQRPRLYEVRTLAEAFACLDEAANFLVLVEVGATNLTEALELLRGCERQLIPFVALLGDATASMQLADLFWEAGASEIVESTRHLCGLLALHDRIAAISRGAVANALTQESFADWARSTLPWQDA